MSRDAQDNGVFSWLQEWYTSQANGEWEHAYGIRISTLDNPGWYMEVDLKDTKLEGVIFEQVELERTADDWVRCSVKDGVLQGACGPKNLTELLNQFRSFAQTEEGD